MRQTRYLLGAALALSMSARAVFAQGWSAGDSPVIASGESVTVSTPQPTLVRITDDGALTVASGGSVALNGTSATNDLNHTLVGSATGQAGLFTVDGGAVSKFGGGNFVVGYNGGSGVLHVASGTLWVSNILVVAGNPDNVRDGTTRGELRVSGGSASADSLYLTPWFPTGAVATVDAGLVTLQGGVLQVGQFVKNDRAVSTVRFEGGTLRAARDSANFIQIGNGGVVRVVIADGQSAVFDTNGKSVTLAAPGAGNQLTLCGDAVGNGGLVKTGAGALILRLAAADNTFTGAVEVVQGALDLGRPLAANQTVTVHAGAAFVMYSPADASRVTYLGLPADRLLYIVGTNTAALDLTALSGTFYDDRLGAPLSGAATLSGALAHSASAGVSGAPFRLLGQGGTLNLTNTTLESKFIQVEGAGTINFMGSRTFAAADAGKIAITDGGYRQDQTFTLADASAATPASLALATGRFNAGVSLDIGVGGYGAFAANGSTVTCNRVRIGGVTGCAGTFTQTAGPVALNAESWVGFDGGTGALSVAGGTFIVNGDLRVAGNPGDQTARVLRPDGAVTVSNALVRCNTFNFTPWWPNAGACSNWLVGSAALLPGGVLEINQVTKNDEPISTMLFDGGLLRARGHNATFLSVNQSYGTLRVLASAGQYAAIDTGAYTVTVAKTSGKLYVSGGGGFKKLGAGLLTYSASDTSYSGDTVVAAGVLRLGDNNQLPDGAGKGAVDLAYGAALDLAGKAESVNRLTGAGRVINTSTNAASALGVLADGTSDTWRCGYLQGSIVLTKLGAGTLTLAAAQALSTNAAVAAGTLRVAASEGYPYYRFKIEAIKNPAGAGANSTQLSELALYDGATNVTPARVGLAYDSTGGVGGDPNVNAFPGAEMPDKAVDGLKPDEGSATNNKWLDFRAGPARSAADRERVWLRIDFAGAQRITRYNWATANDASERDPAAWRLQGSYNGADWTDVDVRTNFVATETRNAWVAAEGFDVATQNAADTISDAASVTLGDGASLVLDGVSETLGALVGLGTVTLNGASLTLSAPAGATNFFAGAIAGSGSLIKAGDGVQQLGGTGAFSGDVVVRQGTLAVRNGAPYTWFRFTIKKNRDDVNVTQISELALYSADGARRNLNLAQGSGVATLLPGQFATPAAYATGAGETADKLFDNATGTKWSLTGNIPSPSNSSTWRIVVMRLAADTPEITGYNLCTANDQVPRNPVTWTLEASLDGTTWVEVDARASAASPGAYFTWYNSGAAYALASRAAFAGAGNCIPDASVVEVRAGATLAVTDGSETIGALRVDLLSAGTITKLTPAANGAIYIVNAAGKPPSWAIPLTVASVENAAALKTWKLYVNGEPQDGYTLSYDPVAQRLRFNAAGLLLEVR